MNDSNQQGVPATESDAPWTAIEVDKYLTHVWQIVAGRLQVLDMVKDPTLEDVQGHVQTALRDITLLCQFDTAQRVKKNL